MIFVFTKIGELKLKVTHATLAAKLLRDSATFFRTLAEDNEGIREQMIENASVFDQVADLVENDPLGVPDEYEGEE